MVCLYCSSKTKIINSRFNKETFGTWRRHKCLKCSAVFTTYEQIDLSPSIKVIKNAGKIEPFEQNKLFISLYKALDHKKDAIKSAQIVKTAIMRQIYQLKTLPTVSSKEIIAITAKVLKRYDATALVKYLADKEQMQSSNAVKRALRLK